MRATAVVVARRDAEAIRRQLKERGHLRSDLAVLHRGEEVAFAVTSAPTPVPPGARIEEHEFPEAMVSAARSYRDLLDLPTESRRLLPRAFDVVGDIVVVRLPDELAPHAASIGVALLEFVPGARLIGWDRGVHGVARVRRLERIAGDGPWVTRHRENGLELDVDLERAYFSPRLAREHARVAAEVRRGERVYDLCCGVGPFATAVAASGRAAEVEAVDLNPRAVELARTNIARVRSATRAIVREEPIEAFLATAPSCDRAILNLPHEGIKYLAQVVSVVRPGGTVHYYEVTDRRRQPGRSEELREMTEAGDAWRVPRPHVVHPYSPQSDLVAYTLERGGMGNS